MFCLQSWARSGYGTSWVSRLKENRQQHFEQVVTQLDRQTSSVMMTETLLADMMQLAYRQAMSRSIYQVLLSAYTTTACKRLHSCASTSSKTLGAAASSEVMPESSRLLDFGTVYAAFSGAMEGCRCGSTLAKGKLWLLKPSTKEPFVI